MVEIEILEFDLRLSDPIACTDMWRGPTGIEKMRRRSVRREQAVRAIACHEVEEWLEIYSWHCRIDPATGSFTQLAVPYYFSQGGEERAALRKLAYWIEPGGFIVFHAPWQPAQWRWEFDGTPIVRERRARIFVDFDD